MEQKIIEAAECMNKGQYRTAYLKYLDSLEAIIVLLKQAETKDQHSLLQLLKQCTDRCEECLLEQSLEIRPPSLSPTKIIQKVPPIKRKKLPLLPISQLMLDFMEAQNIYQSAKESYQTLQTAQQSGESISKSELQQLRRALEDLNIQSAKLDQLTKSIDYVHSFQSITEWPPALLAKQLTILEVKLIQNILKKGRGWSQCLLLQSALCEKKFDSIDLEGFQFYNATWMPSQISALLDFEYFLKNVFMFSLLSNEKILKKEETHADVFNYLLELGHYLLNENRNFGSLGCLIEALDSQPIKRLSHSLWSRLSEKEMNFYNGLKAIYRSSSASSKDPISFYSGLSKISKRTLDRSIQYNNIVQSQDQQQQQHHEKMQIFIVPYLTPFLQQIRFIFREYGTKQFRIKLLNNLVPESELKDLKTEISIKEVIESLSPLGRQKLQPLMKLILDCFQIGRPFMPPATKDLKMEMAKIPKFYIYNLLSLLPGDLLPQHWILTREFQTVEQIIQASMNAEPLIEGEKINIPEEVEDSDFEVEVEEENHNIESLVHNKEEEEEEDETIIDQEEFDIYNDFIIPTAPTQDQEQQDNELPSYDSISSNQEADNKQVDAEEEDLMARFNRLRQNK